MAASTCELNPDAAYVSATRIEGLSKEDLKHLLYLAPDFVIELLSVSDRRSQAEAKMESWIANRVKVGWLVDPYSRSVTVYGEGRQPVTVEVDFVDGSGPVEDSCWILAKCGVASRFNPRRELCEAHGVQSWTLVFIDGQFRQVFRVRISRRSTVAA